MPRTFTVETSTPPGELPMEKLERFKLDIINDGEVVDDQRDMANEDMRFVNVGGGMWEGFLTDTPDVPDRVKLELDTISNPLQRFIGEWNLNRVGVEYKPNDGVATDDDAELLNGIYRANFRDHSGGVATDNAVKEVATCGYGAFKLATAFDDDGDPENEDQHVEWRPIYNAYNAVYWDQAAQRIDKRDARHCTVLAEFSRASFEREWPDNNPSSAYTPNNRMFENLNTRQREVIYVATRYEIVKVKETVFIYNNLATETVEVYSKDDHELIKDELRADDARVFRRERKVVTQRVEKTVFSGLDILENTRRIAGKFIPIVPIYGYHAFVDGTERYRGIVRKLKDAARLFNMQMSQLAENAAGAGQEVPIFLREQVQSPDISAAWADKNNKAYLVIDPATDQDGNIIAPGPISYSKPAALDESTTTLLGIVPNYIKDVSGFEVGEAIKKETSGKALRAMMKRENMNTQVINDNIANAIEWSGEIFQGMAAEIYTTQRLVKTLKRDGTDGSADLQETVIDEETGTLVQTNDLRGKRFKSYSDVGPQYDSMREETVEDLKGMLEILPTVQGGERYMPVLLSVLMNNIHGVGLDPIKDFNRQLMLEQGLAEPETPEEEKMLRNLQQQAQQPNAQTKLVEAATAQQEAEARNLDAASLQKVADANLKDAQTVETLSDVGVNKAKVAVQAAQTRAKAREGLNGSARVN